MHPVPGCCGVLLCSVKERLERAFVANWTRTFDSIDVKVPSQPLSERLLLHKCDLRHKWLGSCLTLGSRWPSGDERMAQGASPITHGRAGISQPN